MQVQEVTSNVKKGVDSVKQVGEAVVRWERQWVRRMLTYADVCSRADALVA